MQTWNNILNYIKRNLGAKLNLLEMTDDEIIEGIQEDVMTLFSQYSPLKKYCVIGPEHLIPFQKDGDNQWKYELPIPLDEYVVDIYDTYTSAGNNDPYYDTKYSFSSVPGSAMLIGTGTTGVFGGGMIDVAIDNVFFNMMESMTAKNTWEFTPPRTIRFDFRLRMACILYNTTHKDLATINPDYYNILFKPLCLGHTMKWLAALRSKYEGLATPIGELRINWQQLEQNGDRIIQETTVKLEEILPDHFLEII